MYEYYHSSLYFAEHHRVRLRECTEGKTEGMIFGIPLRGCLVGGWVGLQDRRYEHVPLAQLHPGAVAVQNVDATFWPAEDSPPFKLLAWSTNLASLEAMLKFVASSTPMPQRPNLTSSLWTTLAQKLALHNVVALFLSILCL